MEFILFIFLILMVILLWRFIDNLFEMDKYKEKYTREEYQLEFYIIDYVKEFWLRAFDFTGKTKRKEFWLTISQAFVFYLLIIGFPIGFYIFSEVYNSTNSVETVNALSKNISYIFWLVAIVNLIPSLSIQVRRLNDIGKEPGWVLLSFIPFISFLLIFWYAKPSFRKGSNFLYKKSSNLMESTSTDFEYVEKTLLKLRTMVEKRLISEEEYEELRKKTLGL